MHRGQNGCATVLCAGMLFVIHRSRRPHCRLAHVQRVLPYVIGAEHHTSRRPKVTRSRTSNWPQVQGFGGSETITLHSSMTGTSHVNEGRSVRLVITDGRVRICIGLRNTINTFSTYSSTPSVPPPPHQRPSTSAAPTSTLKSCSASASASALVSCCE